MVPHVLKCVNSSLQLPCEVGIVIRREDRSLVVKELIYSQMVEPTLLSTVLGYLSIINKAMGNVNAHISWPELPLFYRGRQVSQE